MICIYQGVPLDWYDFILFFFFLEGSGARQPLHQIINYTLKSEKLLVSLQKKKNKTYSDYGYGIIVVVK